MKKNILFFLAAMLILFNGCATIGNAPNGLDRALDDACKTISSRLSDGSRIAVILFYSPSERLSEYAVEELTAQLVSTYRFDVVERRYIDLVRRELNFQLSGEVSDESAQSIGKMLGAQYITFGSFERINDRWRMRTITIHVETAKREVITTANIDMKNRDIDFLIRNSTPRTEAEKVKSPFDGTWRAGDTLWTFDNNNFMLDAPGFITSGTFTFNNTDILVTVMRFKENPADFLWQSFERPAYGSFKYIRNGDVMNIDGYLDDMQITTLLYKR